MTSSRFFSVAIASAVLVVIGPGSAAAQAPLQDEVHLIVAPNEVALHLFSSQPIAVGLGVYPESRDPLVFLSEMGNGAPRTDGAEPARFGDVLCEAGAHGSVSFKQPSRHTADAVMEALRGSHPCGGPGFGFAPEGSNKLFVDVVETDADAQRIVGAIPGDYVVLGLGAQTPVTVGLCAESCRTRNPWRALLVGSITRRPGVLTPYDLNMTLLRLLGIRTPPGFIGSSVTASDRDPSALDRFAALRQRLSRDDSYAPGLAAVTVSLGIGSIIVGLILVGSGRPSAGLRAAQAAVFVLPGWVAAIFVPSGRWEVRGLVVLAVALFGSLLRPKDPARSFAIIGFGSAIAFAVLVAVAPLNPGGEPALSIWGNPLTSWRFFGLQNVPAAIIASGIVVWGVLAKLPTPLLAAIAAAAAVLTGAPAVGANFVGVLTFLFGATMAVLFLRRRRAETWQLLLSGAIAAGGFALALLADAGSPVSHGGRAARSIASGGWSAAWDIIERRLRLNAELIRDFGGGPLWVLGLVATSLALIAWAVRKQEAPLRARAAVLGGTLMAVASLVLEDSGFYSGAVLWFVAADAWLLVTLSERSRVTPPGIASPPGAV